MTIPDLSCSSVQQQPIGVIAWLTTAVVELVLFLMVFVKARKHKSLSIEMSSVANTDIVALMARDSMIYFAMYVSKST